MVRLVHTADVHLDPDAPERREALASVLDRAEAVDADAVTIGGDLFEDATAAERLRPDLRSLFADRPFPVLASPGNHDRTAFEGDAFFGPALRPATSEPFEHVTVADGAARLTCVPYAPTADEDLLVALRDRPAFDGLDCLLLHCSLEAPLPGGTGDEHAAGTRYCPLSRGELGALGFDVVLAGHYHGAERVDLPAAGDGPVADDGAHGTADGPDHRGDPGTFVYPGSPASVTASELGPRSVAVVDDAAARVLRLERLESFHVDELTCTVRPGEETAVLEAIRERVATWADRDVEARITVEGFLEREEAAFAAALDEVCEGVPVENRTRSVAHLLEHPIYEAVDDAIAAIESSDDGNRAAGHADERGSDGAATRPDTATPDSRTPATVDESLAEDARERVLAAMADLAAEGELS